jgi:5-methylcytosine-specific restriction endonuclease McrA
MSYTTPAKQRRESWNIKDRLSYYAQYWQPGGFNPCFYCHEDIPRELRSVDHVIPLSRGGTYNWLNLVLCCRPCNFAKGDLKASEFLVLIDYYGDITMVQELYSHDTGSRLEVFRAIA